MRRLLPLLLLLVAACQPLPHPFAADGVSEPPPLPPPDSADIVVTPVMGAPPTVAKALAEALRQADIPAAVEDAGNRGSDRLTSKALAQPEASGRATVTLAWALRAADGRLLGEGRVVADEPETGWRRGDPAVAQDLAGRAAPSIARLVQLPAPRAATLSEPLLGLRPVTGAPGDGGSTLTRAMSYVLNRAHVALVQKSGDKESFVLTGNVKLSPPEAGKQQVKVSWVLRQPNGAEIGRIDQQNAVPAGSLDGPWGDIAFAVARAAAPGVVALIEKAKTAGAGAS
jgi:hypothetical protein